MENEAIEYVYGLELLKNEFQIEDNIEQTTDFLLSNGQLGERAPQIYQELGTALSFLLQASSCQWGCHSNDHIAENLIRRLANYSFATLRLARLGLYNESVSMLRSIAELANLIELFTVSPTTFIQWSTATPGDRWKSFKPNEVHRKIIATHNRPIVDRSTYAKLCELGPHVSPESALFSHQHDGTVYVGGEFSIFALLLILNELAIMVSACLKLCGHFVKAPDDKIKELTKAGEVLEETATSWLRITNYEERIKNENLKEQSKNVS